MGIEVLFLLNRLKESANLMARGIIQLTNWLCLGEFAEDTAFWKKLAGLKEND